MTCREAIREVFERKGEVLSTQEITSRIYRKYPDKPWKENTIAAHLIALSFNHPSSGHYAGTRQHAFLFSLGRGRYREWDIATDGSIPRTSCAPVSDKTSPSKKDNLPRENGARLYHTQDREKGRFVIERIFGIASFFDAARWEEQSNYNLINFHSQNLSDDAKILTHWLCYITDRQTEFARIWDVAGFIFSELVDKIAKTQSLDLLNPDSPHSFFVRRKDYAHRDYFFDNADHDKYLFISYQKVGDNSILQDYDFESDMTPYFISRFYPSDYMSILYTLHALQYYEFSLSKFIIKLLNAHKGEDRLIPKLLFALYLLTYEGIGQPKHTDINFSKNVKEAEKRTKRIQDILSDKKRFQAAFKTFDDALIFRQKRAWCSLRDFLKSPEFSKYFFIALKAQGLEEIASLKSHDALTQLELPGDVWNNNPKFRHCILKDTIYAQRKDYFPELIRQAFDEIKPALGYPEQFDVTFDFVPRMCDKNNCTICIYGIFSGKGKDFDRVCIQNASKYCPVALVSCNYKILCKGDDCTLLKFASRIVI